MYIVLSTASLDSSEAIRDTHMYTYTHTVYANLVPGSQVLTSSGLTQYSIFTQAS